MRAVHGTVKGHDPNPNPSPNPDPNAKPNPNPNQVRNLSRYAAVYREGAAAHAFYVLMSGAVPLSTSEP